MRGFDVVSLRVNGRRQPNCYAVIVPGATIVVTPHGVAYLRAPIHGKDTHYIAADYAEWSADQYAMLAEINPSLGSKERVEACVAKGLVKPVEFDE